MSGRKELTIKYCPKCGSEELRKYGRKIHAGKRKGQMHQCRRCGHKFKVITSTVRIGKKLHKRVEMRHNF